MVNSWRSGDQQMQTGDAGALTYTVKSILQPAVCYLYILCDHMVTQRVNTVFIRHKKLFEEVIWIFSNIQCFYQLREK